MVAPSARLPHASRRSVTQRSCRLTYINNPTTMNETLFFLQNLGLALLLGSLIGLERERDHKGCSESLGFGGIRTMTLSAVLGYVAYSLFGTDTVIFSILTAGFLLLVLGSYFMSSHLNKSAGATTELAAIFVYLVGVLMGMDQLIHATVITLVVLLLLYFKEALHGFAQKVEKKELYATLKFVAIAFIVLPLLPNATFGPLDVLNPYIIWLMVVFISTISFASYIAIKLLGAKKGIGVGGFLGGLISSTAVSMSFSDMSRKGKKLVYPFVFGILIASSAMFFRVLVEVSVLNRDLLMYLLRPMLAMGFAGILLSLYFWMRKDKKKGKGRRKARAVGVASDAKFSEKELNLKSPFRLMPAIQFGLFFAALLVISKYASANFGDQGLYITALISGLADVDAITVSMANLSAAGDIGMQAAALAITIAAMVNTLVKGLIVFVFASRGVGVRTMLSMLFVIAVGLGALFILNPGVYGFIAI